MAILRKYTTSEALNINTALGWKVLGAFGIIGTGATVNTVLSVNAHTVLLYPTTVALYVSFRVDNTDTSTAAASIVIPAEITTSLTVPRALGGTISLCLQSTSGSSKVCNVVEA